ncbi:MAG TPA: ATP-dependent protease ATPase subunit HslU [Candidatus Kapabacteria bacterium]|nr:ATP-dependent protease ATPase subunit HslU [Candidatus Kapabacteria bacterium]HOM05256.1 ATP-dependent protease ATPase subunit HslU [Candidatus Kapabacteria bacterium]
MNQNELSLQQKETNISDSYLTPRQIVAELDKYVIGQDAAKKAVAIALRNRWRRQRVQDKIKDEINPNNIIMIGPTGVGKTEIARRLAKLAGAPFVKVEATKFTEIGYVGRDVESMVRDLVERSVAMVREEKTKEKLNEAQILAENRILDILIPPITRGPSFDTATDSEIEENHRTREHFREMLRRGTLDERHIEIDVVVDQVPSMQILGPIGLDEMGMNLQDLFGSMMPKKSKKRRLKIADAKKVLQKEEAEKLIDMDAVIREALQKAENNGIIFIDEIDKIASRGSGGNGPEVSREGVQRDLLPIVEGCTVNTRYGQVHTQHILFIASGAFHVSKPSDLVPELQGRFPIRVELKSLTEEDFVKILTVPENALIKQYKALAAAENIELTFDDSAIREIASIAARVNEQITNIGARRLHTIMTTLLEDILFNAPDNISDRNIVIDAVMVRKNLNNIVDNSDLSRYIL